jgi:cysteine dioxygenase
MTQFSKSTLLPDSVAYIDDSIGVHSMGNIHKEKKCITLHCYAPPYQQCHCYDEVTSNYIN